MSGLFLFGGQFRGPGARHGVPTQDGASARKDMPDVDVAQAGGWSSLEALKSA
jgi:hypothetical protein